MEHDPDNALISEMTEPKRGVLREWLGRRLGREAVSDDDTLLIVEPIRAAWKKLTAGQPETAGRWGGDDIRTAFSPRGGFAAFGCTSSRMMRSIQQTPTSSRWLSGRWKRSLGLRASSMSRSRMNG